MLVHEDPNQTTPAFILKEGFQFTEVAVGVGEKPGKCWYRNDVHGMKYFASTYCPGRAAELGDKLWLPQNWRHVHCVDDAPDIVVSHLMGKSRLEYLVLPCPHLMSGVMARGIQATTEQIPLRIPKRLSMSSRSRSGTTGGNS